MHACTLQGDWKVGQMDGKGMLTYADGRVYEGEYKAGLRQGVCRFTYPDGAIYEGHFAGDLRQGRGRYSWADGHVYEGEWKENKMDGKGKMTSARGGVFVGTCMILICLYAYCMHTYLICICSDMRSFILNTPNLTYSFLTYSNSNVTGDWKRDLKEGVGKCTSGIGPNAGDVYEGTEDDTCRMTYR